jgi:hypothetical protein
MTRFFDISRIRWILAGAVAVLALVATVAAVRAYQEYDLTAGVLSVIALVVTMLVGLGSLALARRRIGFELAALRDRSAIIPSAQLVPGAGASEPPPGSPGETGLAAGSSFAAEGSDGTSEPPHPPASTWLRARRERLLAIRAAGVRPDRQVLAEATAAEEAGQSYIGRYFLATTVLLGLAGTVAGLMALGKSGSLAGLPVTFAATLVAILATLALALVQGDLALHEKQALAALEDRTTHQLIPELWPPGEEPAERTVRAFTEFRALIAEAVAHSLDQSAARMARTARSDADRSARALESAAAAIEKQIFEFSGTVGRALEATVAIVEKQLAATTATVETQLTATTATVERQLTRLGGTVSGALETSAETVQKQLTQLGATVGATLETSAGTVEKHMTALGTTLSGAIESSGSRMERQISSLVASVGSVLETGASAVDRQMTELTVAVGNALASSAAAMEKQMVEMTGSVGSTLGTSVATVEKQLGELNATMGHALGANSATVEKQMSKLGATVAGALEAATQKLVAFMAEAAQATTGRAASATEAAVRRSSALAEEAVRTTAADLGRTLQPLLAAEAQRLELVREAFSHTVGGLQQASVRLTELHGVLEGTSRTHVTAIENAGQAVLAAFDRVVLGAGTALDGAAGKLAAAAHELGSGVETLSPKIASLTTELGALGRELALQTARSPEGDIGSVVLGELERIGAGLDRLTRLQQLAGGRVAGFATPTAAELGAAPTAESQGSDVTEETHS